MEKVTDEVLAVSLYDDDSLVALNDALLKGARFREVNWQKGS